MLQEQVRVFIRQNPLMAYPAIGLGLLVVWSIVMMFAKPTPKPAAPAPNPGKNPTIGFSVGGIDQQAYLARLEKNYYDFEERLKTFEDQLKILKSHPKKIDAKRMAKIEARLNELQMGMTISPAAETSPSLELAIADIKPLQPDASEYLPIGSFCKGTLLTGVYAAADVNNPLPVLITLDEAFFGPNKTRIPLKGAFILGKAYGDLVSQRAYIQIVAISAVLPDGKNFEHEANLGYVTDEFGELGIRGRVIRNTGKELALTFMGGLLSGASGSVADTQVTTSSGYGATTREITGQPTKHALFSGLAKSSENLSDYYEKQAENLVPAVHVQSGTAVYFIVQKGVAINGLPNADVALSSSIN